MGWPGADVSGGTFVLGGGSSTASTASRRSSLVGVVLSAAIFLFFAFFARAFVNNFARGRGPTSRTRCHGQAEAVRLLLDGGAGDMAESSGRYERYKRATRA